MMTDKEWRETIAEIESLRFAILNNIMTFNDREELRRKLKVKLERLARRDIA